MTGYHTPVLADVVVRLARDRRRVVDATVGGGGHAARFVAAGAEVLAVVRDPVALAAARGCLGGVRVTYRLGSFGDPDVWSAVAAFQPDFILLDLGVSSHQVDEDRRGFSFRARVPLDMVYRDTTERFSTMEGPWQRESWGSGRPSPH